MDSKMFFGLQGKEIVCNGDYIVCLESINTHDQGSVWCNARKCWFGCTCEKCFHSWMEAMACLYSIIWQTKMGVQSTILVISPIKTKVIWSFSLTNESFKTKRNNNEVRDHTAVLVLAPNIMVPHLIQLSSTHLSDFSLLA